MSKDRTAKVLTVQEYKSLIFYQYSWICTEITNLNSMVGPFTPSFLQIKINSCMNNYCMQHKSNYQCLRKFCVLAWFKARYCCGIRDEMFFF